MSWDDTLNEQIGKLELIASWASIVDYGRCRDHIRLAIADLKAHQERHEEMRKLSKEIDQRNVSKLQEEITRLSKD